MAASNQSSSFMQRVDGELICGVCLELFNAPIMLPCAHNFCRQCVYSIIENGMQFSFISLGPPNSFSCPICQKMINISRYSIDNYPVNKALESIVNLYKSCAPVDLFDAAWNADLEIKGGKCEEHDKLLNRYCDSCDVVICIQCEDEKHSSTKVKHRVQPLKQLATAYQSEIADTLTDLKNKLILLNDKVHRLDDTLNGIQDNQNHFTKQLEQNISAVMSLLRQQQEGLKCMLENKMREKQRPIEEELKKCRAVKTSIDELMKKLSQIRRNQDINLKLKLMKSTSRQLNKLVSFDIDQCLQTSDIPIGTMAPWELSLDDVIAAIESLHWDQAETEADRKDCKEVAVQTTVKDVMLEKATGAAFDISRSESPAGSRAPEHRKQGSWKQRSPGSLEQVRSEEQAHDEIDGDYLPNSENRTKVAQGKSQWSRHHSDEVLKVTTNRKAARVEHDHYSSDDTDEDLREKFKRFELDERGKSEKGRRSFPMQLQQISFEDSRELLSKSSSHKSELDILGGESGESKKKKPFSSHSPTNAEALAKFVARRRTMSPSVSTPALEKLALDSKKSQQTSAARKNVSSPSLNTLETIDDVSSGDRRVAPSVKQKHETRSESTKSAKTEISNKSASSNKVERNTAQVERPADDGSKLGDLEGSAGAISTSNTNSAQSFSTPVRTRHVEIKPGILTLETDKSEGASHWSSAMQDTNDKSSVEDATAKEQTSIVDHGDNVAHKENSCAGLNKHKDISECRDITPESSEDRTSAAENKSDLNLKEESPKPFSKQPIGVKLDFHLGSEGSNWKPDTKKVTVV